MTPWIINQALRDEKYDLINGFLTVKPSLAMYMKPKKTTPTKLMYYGINMGYDSLSRSILSYLYTNYYTKLSALHLAAYLGRTFVVQHLISKGVSLDFAIKRHGTTPLLAAASQGNINTVKLLLHHGANPNAVDSFRNSALIMAAYFNRVDVMFSLIQYGANLYQRNLAYETALIVAARFGHTEAFNLLLANVNQAELHSCNYNGESLLLLAAAVGNLDIVATLIGMGAFINSQSANYYTPLSAAVRHEHLEVASYLLEFGANVDNVDQYGKTPLIDAVMSQNQVVVQLLLYYHPSLEVLDKLGFTALTAAITKNLINIVALLIDAGAMIDRIVSGETPLMQAIKYRHNEIARYLLDHGADYDFSGIMGMTPLLQSISFNNYEAAEMLIEYRANLEKTNDERETPLIFSAKLHQMRFLKLLIKHKAKINSRSLNGMTALAFAKKNIDNYMISYLLKHGAIE